MNCTVTVKNGNDTGMKENKKRKITKCRAMICLIGKKLSKIKAAICSTDESTNAAALNMIAGISNVLLTVICIIGAVLVADFVASCLFIMSAAALLLLMLELILVNKHEK